MDECDICSADFQAFIFKVYENLALCIVFPGIVITLCATCVVLGAVAIYYLAVFLGECVFTPAEKDRAA